MSLVCFKLEQSKARPENKNTILGWNYPSLILKYFNFCLVGPIRYQQVVVVSDPSPSYRNKLYVARTCIDTHLALSPVIAA